MSQMKESIKNIVVVMKSGLHLLVEKNSVGSGETSPKISLRRAIETLKSVTG